MLEVRLSEMSYAAAPCAENPNSRLMAVVAICIPVIQTALSPVLWAQVPSGRLSVPDGFVIETFAEDLGGPRWMAFGPDGDLYVTASRQGRVVRLGDRDADGRAETVWTVIEGLDRPHGIAWRGDELWVVEMTRVLRLEPPAGAAPATAHSDNYAVIVDSLPSGGQWTRSILFEPGGGGFLLSIGSSCNLCEEEDRRRAAIVRYNLDGSGEEVWAEGLRNSVGLALHPETGELWATNNGRDWLGDDLPPEKVNVVRRGRDYGWPFCYGVRVPNPEYSDSARCDGTEPPILTLPAHSAPLGIAFYMGEVFPLEYRGDAFVALHGSWNRSTRVGYKLIRVRVEAGRPAAVEDFVTGWLGADGTVWGRPVQPLVGPDGALYVSDDVGGRIWRVVYLGRNQRGTEGAAGG